MLSMEDALRRNYELGIIHGQRSVIELPLRVINIRTEEILTLLNEADDDDKRNNRQQYDTE